MQTKCGNPLPSFKDTLQQLLLACRVMVACRVVAASFWIMLQGLKPICQH